jgi:hypothetical protein
MAFKAVPKTAPQIARPARGAWAAGTVNRIDEALSHALFRRKSGAVATAATRLRQGG